MHEFPVENEEVIAADSTKTKKLDPNTPQPAHPDSNTSDGIGRDIPRSIGKYTIDALLGAGGMGRVYRGHDPDLKKHVAIKVLLVNDPFLLSKLRDEAATMAQLDHPNILRVYGVETVNATTFIVMEYAPGGTLAEKLSREPPSARWAAETTEILARAVHYAHTVTSPDGIPQGIIHRDLKPSNVLIDGKGNPKVADFGLAKQWGGGSSASATGRVAGTPAYMAPEQTYGNRPITPAVDVYSLGVILYEMLTGRPPFWGGSEISTDFIALYKQVREDDPEVPSRVGRGNRIPRDLDTICLKCLHKSPAGRYPSAEALADDLKRQLDGVPILARPAPVWEKTYKWVRCRPWQAALAIALAIGAATIFYMDRRSRWKLSATVDELNAENEKQRQKIQEQHEKSLKALNDIRKLILDGKLSGVSGLDPLRDQLIGYYKQVTSASDNELDPDKRAKLAEATFHLGELLRRTGDRTKAIDAYRQAVNFYMQHPEPTADLRHSLALARLKLGMLLSGKSDEALEHLDAAADIWRELRQAEPDPQRQAEYDLNAAEVWHQRGELYLRQNNPKVFRDAEQAFMEADKIRKPLRDASVNTTALADYARGHGYLGDLYLKAGDLRSADRSYWESHRTRMKIVDIFEGRGGQSGPDSPTVDGRKADEARFQLSRSWLNLANYQAQLGVIDTSAHFVREALSIRLKVQADNPNETDYKVGAANARRRLAELELASADRLPDPRNRTAAIAGSESVALLTKAREDYQEVLKKSPNDEDAHAGKGFACALLGAALADDPDKKTEVRNYLQDANEHLAKLASAESPDPQVLYMLAGVRALAAELGAPLDLDGEQVGKLSDLDRAIKCGFRGVHPEDVKVSRFFRGIPKQDRKRFEKLIEEMGESP